MKSWRRSKSSGNFLWGKLTKETITKKAKRVGGGDQKHFLYLCAKKPQQNNQENTWPSDRQISWHSGLRLLLLIFSLTLFWYIHLIYQSWTGAVVSQDWHIYHRLLHLLMLEFSFFLNPLWLLLLNWQTVTFKLKKTTADTFFMVYETCGSPAMKRNALVLASSQHQLSNTRYLYVSLSFRWTPPRCIALAHPHTLTTALWLLVIWLLVAG